MLQPYGPSDARLMIVSDCVTYRDLQSGTILNDREFDRMLTEAGLFRQHCFVTSLIKDQISGQSFEAQVPPNKKSVTPLHRPLHDRHVTPGVLAGLDALNRDIDLVRPKIILALGNGPLFALTGKWGIKSWRSSIIDYTTPAGHCCHIIPTYTPGYIQSVWKDRGTAIHDIRKAAALSRLDEPIVAPDYKFLIEPDFATAAKTLQTLLGKLALGRTKLSVDIETRGGHIACTGIAWSKVDAICIPHLRAVVQEMPNWKTKIHYWREEEESFLLHLLYRVLTHPNAEVIGQNFIYDAQYFYRWFHFIPRFKRDTMIAQHSIFSTMPKGLDVLSSLYCEHHVYWKDESKNWNPKLGERQLWSYNCMDCVRTFEIDDEQQSTIAVMSASWPALPGVHDFQQSLFYPVLETMIRGLRVDETSKESLSSELLSAIDAKNAWISEVLGHDLNIKSPKQMQDLFYRVLAQREVKKRSKTGVSVTTDDAALETIATREPLLLPLCSAIRDLRSLGVFRSTFLEADLDSDNRMRCSFNIGGTDTYRFSSSENAFGSGLNLQNIPKGDEAFGLPNVRKLFIPDPGYEFFDIDLDSADLRIVVWESDCKEMKAMFAEGLKPYVEVAKEYYRDPSIDKHHPSYKLFKALCHGTNYLGTPSGLAGRIGLNVSEVERIQKWYYGKFPEIETWQEDLKRRATSDRYVENVFGYRYYIFDRLEGNVINQVVAWVPQSTVACLINRGYHNIHTREKDIHVLLQVHDSLAGQYPAELRDQCLGRIVEHCSVPLPYEEPLVIPVGIVSSDRSWGHCG
jgi:DNA polymerase I-like protein with 3'-5' exonuclease and polymerase domains/uracil-DNA glycosylase